MGLKKRSPCKVNLLLNILGRRPDGFHELESIMQPLSLCDELTFERQSTGLRLSCDDPSLPVDERNLVYRAAAAFCQAADIHDGLTLHLEKRIPLAAGLGGGSSNAATTLLGLNELFGYPLDSGQLARLAAGLGSDVPFFLQPHPALVTGRGERIEPLDAFAALHGKAFLLVRPDFGVSTAWAYQRLARFPEALNGRPGRARELARALSGDDLAAAAPLFHNSLEAPALDKYPILAIIQEFLRQQGALVALMSGSGSTTFALTRDLAAARTLGERFKERFGPNNWIQATPA